jgi:UPF0042 nucleotide-binding protein
MSEATSVTSETQAIGRVGVTISSFGFKFGPPPDAEWMADARMVRNPFWVPALRPHTGLEEPVREYVLGDPVAQDLIERLRGLMFWSSERFAGRDREVIKFAVGCTGGRHRSPAIAEALAQRLREDGLSVTVSHRDVEKPDPR